MHTVTETLERLRQNAFEVSRMRTSPGHSCHLTFQLLSLYSTFQHRWTHYVGFIIFQLYRFSPLSSFTSMFFLQWNFLSKSGVHCLLIGPAAEQNELVNRCWADKLSACKLTCSTYQPHQLIVCQCLQLASLGPKSSFLIPRRVQNSLVCQQPATPSLPLAR